MKKKLFTKVVVGIIVATLLTACGSNSKNNDVSSETPTSTQKESVTINQAENDSTSKEETTKPSTEAPTKKPVAETTKPSTEAPTKKPTEQATQAPTQKPTEVPTQKPTEKPTQPAHTHSWSQATCTSPATCGCGATNGSALGHNFGNNNKTCSNCGVNNPNYQAPHTHNWSTTSWTEDVKTPYFTYTIICDGCGKEFSARLEDSYTGHGVSENAKKVYADYEAHEEAEGHSGYTNYEEVHYERTKVTHHKRVCSCGAEEVID